MSVSIDLVDDLVAIFICDSVHAMKQPSGLHEAESHDNMREVRTATHSPGSFVNRSEAPSTNLLESSVAADSHFLVCWISGPPRRRGRWLFSRHDGRSDAGVLLP